MLLVGVVALKARLRLSYESWRWMHVGLAAAVLVFSGLHTVWLNHALQVPAMSAAFLVLVAIVVTVASYRWLWRGLLDPSTEFVIREVRSESPTISTVVLAPRGDEGSWRFVPGQFAWLRMAQSPTSEEHPFTISSSARDEYTSFTVRHAGDFTRTLTALPPGTPVWVDGPHGAFSGDIGRCSGFVLIAGGVGITPMMSMLRTAADRGDRRPYRLVVIASRPEDLLFREELGFLRSSLDLVVTEVMRRPTDDWEGHYGDLGFGLLSLVLGSTEQPESVDFFLCGPPAMIHDSLEVIDALDVDPGPRPHRTVRLRLTLLPLRLTRKALRTMLRRIPRFLRVSILFVILAAVTLTIYQSWSSGAVGTGGWTQTQWGPLGPADRDLLAKVRQAGLWESPTGQQAAAAGQLARGPRGRRAPRRRARRSRRADPPGRRPARRAAAHQRPTPSSRRGCPRSPRRPARTTTGSSCSGCARPTASCCRSSRRCGSAPATR